MNNFFFVCSLNELFLYFIITVSQPKVKSTDTSNKQTQPKVANDSNQKQTKPNRPGELLDPKLTQNIRSAQLDVVMGVAGDVQAAQMCELLPVQQNVRALTGLASKKARSPIVLRAISQSIMSYDGDLNMKECADIYYSLGVLNYDNEILLSKVAGHVVKQLGKSGDDKVAAVGSIVTSLGILRYRDPSLLNGLSGWIVERNHLWRKKGLLSWLTTLALADFPSDHADKIRSTIVPQFSEADMSHGEWLNFVWTLCVLGLQETSHLESVLK